MAYQQYPGEIGNSNPNYSMLDSTFVRGGGRAVPTLTGSTGLYGLTGKTDQLAQNITKVWVASELKNYILTDINNIGNTSGWTVDTVDISSKLNTSGGTLSGGLTGTTLLMSNQISSTVTNPTSPFIISSTGLTTNLNADLLDGQHGSFYQNLVSGTVNILPKYNSVSGITNSSITDNGTNVTVGESLIVAGGLTGTTLTLNNGSLVVKNDNVNIFEISPSFTGSLLEVSDVDNNVAFSIQNDGVSVMSAINTSGSTIFSVQEDGSFKQNSITMTSLTSTTNVMTISKLSCNSLFFDYFIKKTSVSPNAFRSGTVMCVHDGVTGSTYVEIATPDLNNITDDVSFSVQIIDTNIVLIATITSGTWDIKIGVRKL